MTHRFFLSVKVLFKAHGIRANASGSNLIFTEGNIEITAVTTTTVEGRMHLKTDSDDLNGTFVLERVTW